MRVRMKATVTGTRDGVSWPASGQEITLPDDEATALCSAGMAEPVVSRAEERRPAPAKPETRTPGPKRPKRTE